MERDAAEVSIPLVGSAEPLSYQETLHRLRELEAWGVDLSLVRSNLQRSPTELALANERQARVIEAMRVAYHAGQVRPLRP